MFGPPFSSLLADANDGFYFPIDASNFASDVDSTFSMILWICLFFFIPIAIILAWFAYRYHQPKGGKATSRVRHNNVLEISWSVLPAFVLVVMFIRGSWGYLDQRQAPAGSDEINVQAYQWGWSFNYGEGITSRELHVVKDRPTKLIMQSTDVIHSLFVPAFRIKRDVVPGRYNLVWFVPTVASEKVSDEMVEQAKVRAKEEFGGDFNPENYRIGEGNGFTEHGYTYFDLFCTEYCGKDHSNMHSFVVVHETQEDMNEWLVDVNKKPPEMTMEEYGLKMYNDKNCRGCHSLQPGERIVGPPFAGLYGSSRPVVAGGEVTADENYIRESILNPMAHVVVGYNPVMPTFRGQLTEEQLSALVAFIKSLSE